MNLKQIANHLGISQATVSLVRKGRRGVSDAVREKVQALLIKNGFSYVPYDPRAESPPQKWPPKRVLTRCIRLLTFKKHAMLVDGNDGFVTSIIDALDREARLMGYQILVSVFGPENYASVIHAAVSTPADGALVIGTEMAQRDLFMLNEIQIPLVILDSDFICSPFSCVTMNNRELAFSAVQHLIALGHPEIGYLHSSVETGNFQSRTQGYHEALSSAGKSHDPLNVFDLRPTVDHAYQDMKEHLRAGRVPPSAFFADNDILALGAMKALSEAGYSLPEDVSVIGVDNIAFGSIATPSLSTMRIPSAEIGRWAVRLLLQALESPETHKTRIQIGASLLVRESTAPYRKSCD